MTITPLTGMPVSCIVYRRQEKNRDTPRDTINAPTVPWNLPMAVPTVPESLESLESLSTIGELARDFRVSVHQVRYAVDSRGIKPARRVGRLRIWDAGGREAIGRALGEIAGRTGGRNLNGTSAE